MADELMGTSMETGQPDTGQASLATGTTAPATDGGQPGGTANNPANAGTANSGAQSTGADEDFFYDPKTFEETLKTLPEDVQKQVRGLHKELQGSYTKKTQSIADARKKAQAYDAFYQDPITNLQKMAAQAGYRMTRAEAAEALDGQTGQQDQNWQPQTWEDVFTKAEERARAKVMAELSPQLQQVQAMRAQTVEEMLDKDYPDWRNYESEMTEIIRQHPTMANDVATVYRMAVPPEVQERRIYERLKAKQEAKVNGSKIGAGSSTNKQPGLTAPAKFKDINEAVAFAKAKLQSEGKWQTGR